MSAPKKSVCSRTCSDNKDKRSWSGMDHQFKRNRNTPNKCRSANRQSTEQNISDIYKTTKNEMENSSLTANARSTH